MIPSLAARAFLFLLVALLRGTPTYGFRGAIFIAASVNQLQLDYSNANFIEKKRFHVLLNVTFIEDRLAIRSNYASSISRILFASVLKYVFSICSRLVPTIFAISMG